MKKLKTIVSLLLAVAICVLLPNFNSMTVSAEGPVTYIVKHVDSNNEWRFQTGSSTWDENGYHRELYYLHLDIKDGDILIVDGPGNAPINISARLSNLTFVNGAYAVISATSIDDCYVLKDSVAAISGDVTNAYVYDNAVCTFNNNVGTLSVLNDPNRKDSTLDATVSVAGTVNHLIGNDGAKLHYELYSFPAGKLVIDKGDVKTDASLFSTTAPAAGAQTNTSTQNQSSADEYDDVPKTGDSAVVFWLLGISALCFAGRRALKKA